MILTINAGSSSLKFALFSGAKDQTRDLSGNFERIGLSGGKLTFKTASTGEKEERAFDSRDHLSCATELADLLKDRTNASKISAIGHRIVHGGPRYDEPQLVNQVMVDELTQIRSFDPNHLPAELALVTYFGANFPQIPQVACFDTAFHRNMPRVAKVLPFPRCYEARGLRRYGFHGLSYAYVMVELKRVAGAVANGRVILAHLGNGASMVALRGGQVLDTTMAFTPASGLVMSTRSGDIDPGVPGWFARNEGMTPVQFDEMVNTKSGLFGISETSSDVRDLLAHETQDERAAEALASFCYQAKKWIGALSAVLGGLDTLVFSGGIGENSSPLRARICSGLDYMGIHLDAARNDSHAPVISKAGEGIPVRLIHTDEELQMSRTIRALLKRKHA